MADIFLSYAREDEARAGLVAGALGERGWSVFWDRRIRAGSAWDEIIERELRASQCVVVLWSSASVRSRWVKTEARFGLQRNALVPAQLDECELPIEFGFVESAQLQKWTGGNDNDEFSTLVEGIAQHVKKVRTATPTPSDRDSRRPMIQEAERPTASPISVSDRAAQS